MAIIKCKMCGGELEIEPGATVGTCEYCGSKQTLPKLDDDRKANLYDRANHFRRNNEFDKASGVYERLLAEDSTDAEAYWSLVLCRYGIEYVEDPATHKRVPTVNRAQYTSIFDDDNYKQAIAYADVQQKAVYEEEAKAINEIQKGILAISQKEDPFDVFICYKETDNNGRRTMDSVLANDLYHQLTNEGFKVFFSRITLEDKLGVAYEPYIFAALNSAKVMVVLGTRPEYFNAVWVKNEWSRYLSIVKQSGGKKVLIPAYRDMDPYDLPEEFSHLQAQDMSKLGFMQDLIRGIRKILMADKTPAPVQPVLQQTAAPAAGNVTALMKRGMMALEDGEWNKADDFFEEVLNQDAECAEAYMGKLLAKEKAADWETYLSKYAHDDKARSVQTKIACEPVTAHIQEMAAANAVPDYLTEQKIVRLYEYNRSYRSMVSGRQQSLKEFRDSIGGNKLLNRVRQYASAEYRAVIDGEIAKTEQRFADWIKQAEDDDAAAVESIQQAYAEYIRQTDEKVVKLNQEALETGWEAIYQEAEDKLKEAKDTEPKVAIVYVDSAVELLEKCRQWKDSEEKIKSCRQMIAELNEKIEFEAQEAKRKAEENRKKQAQREEEMRLAQLAAEAKRKRIIIVALIAAVLIVVGVAAYIFVLQPMLKYNAAKALFEAGSYEEAIAAFEALGDYKDSTEQSLECRYRDAGVKAAAGNYQDAYAVYRTIHYKDVDILLSTDDNLIAAVRDAAWQPGNYVNIGTYPQTKAGTDSTPIEWLVLDRDGSNALVISRYGLDAVPYNTTETDITWEKCSLRSWLNKDFLNAAFTAEEQEAILTTDVDNSKSQGYSDNDTNGGNNTQDKIFLLSYAEANRYFGVTNDNRSNTGSRIEPTAYAIARGAYNESSSKTADGAAAGWWWLRSPGRHQYGAAYIYYDGSLSGNYVDRSGGCVRPALWINLDALPY